MANAYITLEELRDTLSLPLGDEPGLLAAIAGAEAAIDAFCNAAPHGLAAKEVTETQRGRGITRLFVRRPMITAVASCTVAGVAVPVEIWDEASLVRLDGLPFDEGARVVVTYTAGYAAIPANLKAAAILTASAFYSAPKYEMNTMNQSMEGVMTGMVHQAGMGAIPPGAQNLLLPLRWVVPF